MIIQLDNRWGNRFQINATVIISVIQIIILALLMSISAIKKQTSFTCILYYAGAKYTPAIKYHYQFHRLINPIFLHSNISHILSNLFAQIILCYPYEIEHGTKSFLLLYFLSGISGNVVSALYFSQDLGEGASGAIFGFMGYELTSLIMTNQPLQKFYWILLVLSQQVALIFLKSSNIDYSAHFGGMLAGILWYRKEKKILALLICFGIICIFLRGVTDIQYC